MFDGLAMAVKLRVGNGAVRGSQRFIQTEQYKWVQGQYKHYNLVRSSRAACGLSHAAGTS